MGSPHTPFRAPVVDRLSVRVVVDSAYERFLPAATHPFVAIRHVGKIPGRQMTTVDEFEALEPDVVIPMHCSGAPFIETMRRRMPDRLVTTNVGSRFTFGA